MGDVRTAASAQTSMEQRSPWPGRLKAACFVTTSAFFGLGLRAAYKQAKPLDPRKLSHSSVMSGVGFASKALGIATLLTVSGFSLLVLSVSTALDVNTPRQFGTKMRALFGDRYRIEGSKNGQSFDSLSELFEAANKGTIAPGKVDKAGEQVQH